MHANRECFSSPGQELPVWFGAKTEPIEDVLSKKTDEARPLDSSQVWVQHQLVLQINPRWMKTTCQHQRGIGLLHKNSQVYMFKNLVCKGEKNDKNKYVLLTKGCYLLHSWRVHSINKMWYIHTTEYLSALKRMEVLIHYNVAEPWRHYTKWNKPVMKGQILFKSACMRAWNSCSRRDRQ